MSSGKITILIFFFFSTTFLFAQAELDIKPNRIEFEDVFNRIETVYLINKSSEILTIDSIKYNPDFYLLDFENNLLLPFMISPYDTITVNVSLTGFYYITAIDTSDTLLVYNNGINSPGELRSRIDFFENEFGTINGTVTAGVYPLPDAFIYFFYNGVYLLDTATTDSYGKYSITLPEGDYTVTAQKEGYHLTFYDNTFDPFFASTVELEPNASLQVDLTLKAITDTSKSIKGRVFNSSGTVTPNRGMVIVRKGKHVPSNSPQTVDANSNLVYAGLINPDGTYKVYMDTTSYYFVQSYTNYYLPGYYNDAGKTSVFWQGSDTVLIDNSISNKNIFLARDSSYGGGTVSGKIIFENPGPGIDYEGITLMSRAEYNDRLCSYNFSKQNGTYTVPNIPYGTYEIVAQKIGFENSISQIVRIDSAHTSFTGIDIVFGTSGVDDEYLVPHQVELYPSYPNPFNPVTNITFNLPEAANVQLKVLNILGETVEVLFNSYLNSGKYNYNFSAKGLSSVVYIVTLKAGNSLKTQKIVLLK